MPSDPYRDLARTFEHLTRRPPRWIEHAAACGSGDLNGIVKTIRDDYPDAAASDTAVRMLMKISTHDRTATTVLLYALSSELRARLRRSATAEFRCDALADLAAVLLEGDMAGTRLGHRFVNRARNRTSKQHHRVRHHGRSHPTTVDPLPSDLVEALRDRESSSIDVAEVVAARVDLERFHSAVTASIGRGVLSAAAWETYVDHRLSLPYVRQRPRSSSRERVTSWRVAKSLRPIINEHLAGHAA
jgi:hypothetical protein